jgi:uncharacterized protein (TIGR02996 family)
MTEDEAFLQALLQTPDDDTPRLIYADWLEEQGDPRGEFIRLQCALAQKQMASLDPRYWDLHFGGRTLGIKGLRVYHGICPDPRNEPVPKRERELVEAHADKWLQRFGDFSASLRATMGFFRGVVNSLGVAAEGIEWREMSSQVEQVFAIPTLDRFRVFLRDDNVGRELTNMMRGSRFRALHLDGPGAATWASDGDLVTIDQTLRELVSGACLRPLTYLKVSSCSIGLEAFEMLLNSPYLDNLRTLELEGYRDYWDAAGGHTDYPVISRPHLQALLGSRAAGRLTSLSLPGNGFTKEEAEMLASSACLTSLRCLNLAGNAVGARQEQALREGWGRDLFFLSSDSKEWQELHETRGERYQYYFN